MPALSSQNKNSPFPHHCQDEPDNSFEIAKIYLWSPAVMNGEKYKERNKKQNDLVASKVWERRKSMFEKRANKHFHNYKYPIISDE